tara:strand:- start:957 stop:1502 length:546 start_codon:yes stop_codon:yes gene_type:complete
MQLEINKSLTTLKAGGIILYPTDTIWGIGCDATNPKAVEKIYTLKRRTESKALISLASNVTMIEKFADNTKLEIPPSKKPTTIIYKNVTGLAKNLIAQDNTVAFRVPNDEFCHLLITAFGLPIVSTSANISGNKIPKQFSEISKEIRENVDYIVNLRHNELMTTPSTIIKISEDGSIKKIR